MNEIRSGETRATDLTAALDEIRHRGYRNGARGALCARLSDAAAEDIPQLLAVADALLELAGEWIQKSQALDAAAEYVAAEDPEAPGAGLKYARSIAYGDCAVTLRQVIARTLRGEHPSPSDGPGA